MHGHIGDVHKEFGKSSAMRFSRYASGHTNRRRLLIGDMSP